MCSKPRPPGAINYVRSLIKAKLLILDDLGLRSYTHEEATSLMDVLEDRYHKVPLIVTSQVQIIMNSPKTSKRRNSNHKDT